MKLSNTQTITLELITQKEVETLMQRGGVDEILREEFETGIIREVSYDNNKKTNYQGLVFQEYKKLEDRVPTLVLFHDGESPILLNPEVQNRLSIVFKVLANKYVGKVQFVVYDFNKDPAFHRQLLLNSRK